MEPLYDIYGEVFFDGVSKTPRLLEGQRTIMTNRKIAMDPNKEYYIEVDVKSLGKNESCIVLAAKCFDESDQLLESFHQCYRPNTVLPVGKVDGENVIVYHYADVIENWYPKNFASDQRLVGFYFDGNMDQLPYIAQYNDVCYDKSQGIYLDLETPLPKNIQDKIIPGITVVANHFRYVPYLSLYEGYVKHEWQKISVKLNGWNTSHEDNKEKFRKGTKHFRLGFIANFLQSSNEMLAFKNFTIKASCPLE